MDKDTVLQEQRKRTMEALERRFAFAKVEVLQQQKKQNISVGKFGSETNSGNASTTPNHLIDHSANLSSNGSFKKDAEENHPAYSQLSQPMNYNLLPANPKLSSRKGTIVDKLLHDLLQSGDSAQKYMQGSKSMKIDNWILLDNYVQGCGVSTGSRIRALQNHSKRSKKHMSMRQLKKSGAFDLVKDFQKFDKFEQMHDMWKGYMAQLLKATGKNQLAQCLLNADLHGAMILVAECKISNFTGVSGIMVRETAETFGIITRNDKFLVIPKRVSVFIFQVDCWKITLQGDKLTSRLLSL